MTASSRSDKAEARTQAQRERILQAAQQCFIEHGFHAAGMAKIAETAGMSPGLIYRYFENKAAIIQAIVQRQLELVREDIRLNRKVDLARELVDAYGSHRHADGRHLSAPLLLELSAEATRDPQIAAAVQHFDRQLRQSLQEWLGRGKQAGGPGIAAQDIPKRVLILQLLFEGMRLRETREPDLDRTLLEDGLRDVIAHLLQP
ncbi:MAG: TetR/AcrR family transcriptional regulator [Xanthomonadaceae bacterium]|nr:TetR/AcrR family transcriptional regulator [Xanthomonadaceae bacterium]